MDNTNQHSNLSFYGLGIAPGILEILKKISYTAPTPIQHQSIPIIIEGKDLVGIAQTGTGKTLAFGIPMMQRLAASKGMGLILLPTRELALQIDSELRKIGNSIGLRTAVLIGGVSMKPQIEAIRRNPHIIIATPGRLIDYLHHKTVSLKKVNILVLDESDRMLDMGFLPQISEILKDVPKERQTMLFSATISPEIMRIASVNMKLPIRVEIAPTGTTVDSVSQDIFIITRDAKLPLLEKVLNQRKGSTLIFTRTKYGAHRLARAVKAMGHSATEIHSNCSFAQRKNALEGFKAGKYRVLVATDIMARGIDVVDIELVINYDLPSQAEDYVHRIGRTARAGKEGHAISFVTPSEQGEIRAIEWLIRKKLNVSTIPEFPTMQFAKPRMVYSSEKRRRRKLGRTR
ncbi:MAG: DEAD/DEAH box helicase [Patescibacteria group bacterium]